MKTTRTCRIILFMILCLLFTVPAFADVLTIPDGVKEIGEEAFYGDTSLDEVVLPEGIEKIGARAFWGSSLSSINLPASLEHIEDDALDPNVDIQVTAVKGSKAYDWAVEKGFIQEQEESGGITFRFEDNGDGTCTVTEIQSLTYDSYSKDLVIPSYGLEGKPVTAIGEYAFASMSNFKAGLVIPNSVKTIGNSAFSMCSGFTGNLTLPKSVTTIGDNAFAGCSGFSGSLIIPDSVIRIEESAFGSCSGLDGTLTIGNNVAYIGPSAFAMCTKLTGHVVIPPSVKEMGSSAFFGCSGLEEITVSDGITHFDFNTIIECGGLKRLNLPNSITSITDFDYDRYITTLSSAFTVYSGSECVRNWAYENNVSLNDGAVDYTPQMKRLFAQATNIRGESELYLYLEMDINYLTYPIADDFDEYRNNIKGYWGVSNNKSNAELISFQYAWGNSGRSASIGVKNSYWPSEGETCPEHIYLWFDMENSVGSVSYGPYQVDVQVREDELDNYLIYYPIDEATCSVAIEAGYYEEKELVIPDRAPDGRRVTHIRDDGFSGAGFSSIKLPDSLNEIGHYAFYYMENVTFISVPKHVKKIDADVFKDCTALETVVLPESIEYIDGKYDPESYKPLFGGCTSLSAIYCVRDSYAWNWCAENGYEDLLVAWDGIADPRPEQEYLTGAFDEETVTIPVGTKQQISGWVKSTSNPISRVTITILGYAIPDDSDRYASKSFEGLDLTEASLADYDVFTLDTTRAPLNTPGEYTINLWASAENENGILLDTMVCRTSLLIPDAHLCGTVTDQENIPVENASVFICNTDNRADEQYTVTDANGSWSFDVVSGQSYVITVIRDGYTFEEQRVTISEQDLTIPAIIGLPEEVLQVDIRAEMSQEENIIAEEDSVVVGTYVDFRVDVPENVSRVRLLVDGVCYRGDTYEAKNGTALFTRMFTQAGDRSISFQAEIEAEWSEPSFFRTVKIVTQSDDPLAEPEITEVTDPAFMNLPITVKWKPVEHADGYHVYLYSMNGAVLDKIIEENGKDLYSHQFDTDTLQAGICSIEVIAYGAGYSQTTASVRFNLWESEYTGQSNDIWPQGERVPTYSEPDLRALMPDRWVNNLDPVTILNEVGDFYYIRMKPDGKPEENRYVLKKDMGPERYISEKGLIRAVGSVVENKTQITVYADQYAVKVGIWGFEENGEPYDLADPLEKYTYKDSEEVFRYVFTLDPVPGETSYTAYVYNYDYLSNVQTVSVTVCFQPDQILELPDIENFKIDYFGPTFSGRDNTFIQTSRTSNLDECEIFGYFSPADEKGISIYQIAPGVNENDSYIYFKDVKEGDPSNNHDYSFYVPLNREYAFDMSRRRDEDQILYERYEYRFLLVPRAFLNDIEPEAVTSENLRLLLSKNYACILTIEVFPPFEGAYTMYTKTANRFSDTSKTVQIYYYQYSDETTSEYYGIPCKNVSVSHIILGDEFYWAVKYQSNYERRKDYSYAVISPDGIGDAIVETEDLFDLTGYTMKVADGKLRIQSETKASETKTVYVLARCNKNPGDEANPRYNYSLFVSFEIQANKKVDKSIKLSSFEIPDKFNFEVNKTYEFAIMNNPREFTYSKYLCKYCHTEESTESMRTRYIEMLKYAYARSLDPLTTTESDFDRDEFERILRNRLGPAGFGLENDVINRIFSCLSEADRLERSLFYFAIWDYEVELYTDPDTKGTKFANYRVWNKDHPTIYVDRKTLNSGDLKSFMIVWFHENGHALDFVGLGKNDYSSATMLQKSFKMDFRNMVYALANGQETIQRVIGQCRLDQEVYSYVQTYWIAEYLMDWDRDEKQDYYVTKYEEAGGRDWGTVTAKVCQLLNKNMISAYHECVSGNPNACAVVDALPGLVNNHPDIIKEYEGIWGHPQEGGSYWEEKGKTSPVGEFAAEYYSSKMASWKAREVNLRFFGNTTAAMDNMEREMLDWYFNTKYKDIY